MEKCNENLVGIVLQLNVLQIILRFQQERVHFPTREEKVTW